MAPRIQTEADKLEARHKILDAAKALFIEKGTDAVTMREVAKRVSYSPTTIYLYFEDREALLHHLCVRDYQQLGVALKPILEIPDPVLRMRALGKAYAEFAIRYPYHYQLMFMTVRHDCEAIKHDVDPGLDSYALLNQVVQYAFDQGCFRPEHQEPALIAQTIWSAVHGICALQITLGESQEMHWVDFEQRLTTMQQCLEAGLLKDEYLKGSS